MSEQDIIDIPEGRVNDYLVHGFFMLLAAGILLLVHWALTVLLVVVAVGLFRVSSGIEIEVAGCKARVYKRLGTFRIGTWRSTVGYQRIMILYTNESQVMNSRGSSTNVRARTYDLQFANNEGARMLFHEFTDHAKAVTCAELMAKHWSLALTDEVQELRQRAQANAQGRRR
jgi:hypothetical protein